MSVTSIPHLLVASSLLTLVPCGASPVGPLSTASESTTITLPSAAVERPVTFPAAEGLSLPGTLTLPPPDPRLSRKPPLAVLVQGSGVQDRDGTTGPNKLQQQLAWALATRGIATLRYDRRPKVAPESFAAHPDLDHEVVLDASAALAWAGTVPETDPHRIFLIGHSLGAQLGPDIVAARLRQAPSSVAGLVLLAGIARPIDQVMREQVAALGTAQGATSTQITAIQTQYDALWTHVRDPQVSGETPSGLGGGVTIGYLRDWLRRDPAALLKTLAVPCFVARGTNDLNTTAQDFAVLKAAATAPGSQAMEIPNLSHSFMPVVGPPNGREVL